MRVQKLTVTHLFKNIPDLKRCNSSPPIVPIHSQLNPILNLPSHLYSSFKDQHQTEIYFKISYRLQNTPFYLQKLYYYCIIIAVCSEMHVKHTTHTHTHTTPHTYITHTNTQNTFTPHIHTHHTHTHTHHTLTYIYIYIHPRKQCPVSLAGCTRRMQIYATHRTENKFVMHVGP